MHLRSEMHFTLTKARKDAQGVVLAFFLTNGFRSLSSKFLLWDAKSSFEVVFESFSWRSPRWEEMTTNHSYRLAMRCIPTAPAAWFDENSWVTGEKWFGALRNVFSFVIYLGESFHETPRRKLESECCVCYSEAWGWSNAFRERWGAFLESFLIPKPLIPFWEDSAHCAECHLVL